jgi:hypothetical protein
VRPVVESEGAIPESRLASYASFVGVRSREDGAVRGRDEFTSAGAGRGGELDLGGLIEATGTGGRPSEASSYRNVFNRLKSCGVCGLFLTSSDALLPSFIMRQVITVSNPRPPLLFRFTKRAHFCSYTPNLKPHIGHPQSPSSQRRRRPRAVDENCWQEFEIGEAKGGFHNIQGRNSHRQKTRQLHVRVIKTFDAFSRP